MHGYHNQAADEIDAHGRRIDELHRKLAESPGCDKEKLEHVVATYKTAHESFREDALICIGN